MKQTWKTLLIPPILIPLLITLAIFTQHSPENYALSFIIFFIGGTLISYCIFFGLYFPGIILLTELKKINIISVAAWGLTSGAIAILPILYVTWLTSGENSGPPENFMTYATESLKDIWFWVIFPGGGLVTAITHWYITKKMAHSEAIPPNVPTI